MKIHNRNTNFKPVQTGTDADDSRLCFIISSPGHNFLAGSVLSQTTNAEYKSVAYSSSGMDYSASMSYGLCE
jgi:hypothetical protein